VNRDGGAYNLPTTYDPILVMRSSSMSRDHMPFWQRGLSLHLTQSRLG